LRVTKEQTLKQPNLKQTT